MRLMLKRFRNNPKVRKVFWVTVIILIVIVLVYIGLQGGQYFTRRGIRQLQLFIRSYGPISPLIVVILIIASTAIPPLPLPIPLIEIAAGLLYGFFAGFLLVWFSQVVSSLVAYWMTRILGRRFFKKLLSNNIFNFYRRYINQKGPLAVFVTRATLAAPFNVVSFLSGLTQMNVWQFFVATALGTIPESLLFTFVGSIIRSTRLSLWYVFILIVILGAVGPVLTYAVIRSVSGKRSKS